MVEGLDVRDNCMYTRVLEFHRKDSPRLVFICTSHMGTRSYYKALQNKIDKVTYGLYEGIQCLDNEPKCKLMTSVDILQKGLAKYSGLVLQGGRLKYDENSWMLSDIHEEEIIGTRAEEGAECLGTVHEQLKRVDRLYKEYPKEISEMYRRNVLWQTNIYLFEPSLLEQNSGLDEVMVEHRNNLLFANLERMAVSGAFEEIGIVYGAMHFSGIEHLLKDRGYELEKIDELRVFGLNDPIEVSSD